MGLTRDSGSEEALVKKASPLAAQPTHGATQLPFGRGGAERLSNCSSPRTCCRHTKQALSEAAALCG